MVIIPVLTSSTRSRKTGQTCERVWFVLPCIGLIEYEKLGAMDGGIVEEFTKYSIIMALVQIEWPELY